MMLQILNDGSNNLFNSDWVIMPFHIPILDIAPPPGLDNVNLVEIHDNWIDEETYVIQEDIVETITKEDHDTLLEQSLVEYAAIWRELADR